MKKRLLSKLFVLSMSYLFISCSQESISSDSLVTENSEYKIDQVLIQKNEESQRNAYTLLSNQEKMNLWLKKYEKLDDDNVSKSEKISLNNKQKSLIEELKSKLTENIFDENSNEEKEYFLNIYAPNFLKRAQKVFTYDQIGFLFYKISKPISNVTLKSLSTSAKSNSEKGCDCAAGGFFTCQWGQDKCNANTDCKDPRSGCGFMFSAPCDGDCKLF